VTGCGYINPQQTSEQYSASDGTRTDLGPLKLRNMMIISDGEDKPGRVMGAVYNDSSRDAQLTISGAGGAQTQISVKKNSYVLLNKDSADEAVLSSTGAKPGALAELSIRENGTNQSAKFKVPVLDATIVDYKKYIPSAAPSGGTAGATPTSTASPTSSANEGTGTGTASPSSTASPTISATR
jgi:hypothetical protein